MTNESEHIEPRGDAGAEDRFWQAVVSQVGAGAERPLDLDQAEARMAHGADAPLDAATVLQMVREVTGTDLSSAGDPAAEEGGPAPLRVLEPLTDDSEPPRPAAERRSRPWMWLVGGAAAAAIAGVSFMTTHWDSRQGIETLHFQQAQSILEDPLQRMEDRNLAVGGLSTTAIDCIQAMRAVEGSDAVFFEEVRVRLAFLSQVLADDVAPLDVPADPVLDLLPGSGLAAEAQVLLDPMQSLERRRSALHRLTALASQAIVALVDADPPELHLRVSRDQGLALIRRFLTP